MTALIHTGVARIPVRVNWGRWILDCARCAGATWVVPGADLVCCLDCGTATEAVWPSDEIIYGVERLLLMRPDPNTRNWTADETLHDLLEENMHHGIMAYPALEPGLHFALHDDSISVDKLPSIGSQVLKAVTT